MKFTLEQLDKAAQARGASARRCTEHHWQVRARSSSIIVNVFPGTEKIYVGGLQRAQPCQHMTADEVVSMLFEAPPVVPRGQRDSRGHLGEKRRWKERALRGRCECYWCQAELTRETLTIDHRVPLARGGIDAASNWVPACTGCNNGRGHDMPELVTT